MENLNSNSEDPSETMKRINLCFEIQKTICLLGTEKTRQEIAKKWALFCESKGFEPTDFPVKLTDEQVRELQVRSALKSAIGHESY